MNKGRLFDFNLAVFFSKNRLAGMFLKSRHQQKSSGGHRSNPVALFLSKSFPEGDDFFMWQGQVNRNNG